MAEPVQVIQATLAPAFLITGAGIFLNFAQTRLFRVVDRARETAAAGEAREVQEGLLRRARTMRNAIALGVLSIAFTVMTAILLMASQLAPGSGLGDLAPVAFSVAMLALFAALCFALWDTMLSVRSVARGR